MRFISKIILAVIVTAVIFSAGCIDNTVYPEATPEMSSLLDEYAIVMNGLEQTVSAELLTASEKLSGLDMNSDEARTAIRYVYADLAHVSAAVFYDEATGEIMMSPRSTLDIGEVAFDIQDSDKNDIVLHEPYNSDWFGELISVSAPVYNPDGTYRGRVAAIIRVNEIANFVVSEIPELEDYYISAISSDNTIIYSPQKFNIGKKFDSSDVKIEKETPNSGIFYKKIVNTMTHEEIPVTAVWKTEPIFDTSLTYSVGTYNYKTDYSKYLDSSVTKTDLINYVDSLYYYAVTHSKSDTLEYINKLKGVSPASVYPAFAVDYDGKVLAMAEYPEYTGKYMNNVDDAYEIRMFKEMEISAKRGAGYEYFFIDTSMNSLSSEGILSLAYVVPVGNDYFIGAEIPILDEVSDIDSGVITRIDTDITNIMKYLVVNGREEGLEYIMDSEYNDKSDTVYLAVSYGGICMAFNSNPELVGKDLLGVTDHNKDSAIRDMLIFAKNGGGFMYYLKKLDNGTADMYLCYVTPLENSWLLCTAVIVEEEVTA